MLFCSLAVFHYLCQLKIEEDRLRFGRKTSKLACSALNLHYLCRLNGTKNIIITKNNEREREYTGYEIRP